MGVLQERYAKTKDVEEQEWRKRRDEVEIGCTESI